mmetsp:Transcript_32541/g.64840  ORF Transcript_32541/g.64840 Transcript_32541/m.64840 type:complete len:159 (-) Transcript_32541:36-512(-)
MALCMRHDVPISAERFWALTEDHDWDEYMAAFDDQRHDVLSLVKDSTGQVTRVCKVTALVNPLPEYIRKMLRCGDDFYFTITEQYWTDKFDEAHAKTFSTVPLLFPDRIEVHGRSWLEPLTPTSCVMVGELHVKVTRWHVWRERMTIKHTQTSIKRMA